MTEPAADAAKFVAQIVEATREANQRANWASSQSRNLNIVSGQRTVEIWGGEAALDYLDAHQAEIKKHALSAAEAKHDGSVSRSQ